MAAELAKSLFSDFRERPPALNNSLTETTWSRVGMILALCTVGLADRAMAARYDGQLTIRVIDDQTKKLMPARMELRNARGRPVRVRPEGSVSHGDYFVFDGTVTLQLKKGSYQFLIEAGPEFQTRPGHFTIDRHAEDNTEVVLRRRVNMQEEGWWAGDLDVRHPPQELPLLMKATGVDFVPMIVRENLRGKCEKASFNFKNQQNIYGSLDYRRGGGLLFFQSDYLDVCGAEAEGPSSALLASATEADVVALTPFAWDLPLWVATGKLDAVQVIHRHALAGDVVDNEGWGRKRDTTHFPGKTGNGRWSEAIYHHLLNCGIRLPPAAGSGSGANGNPVGTNRVYAQCGAEFTPTSWFTALREGRVVVTNGPLLRTQVEGHPPGHGFQLDAGETREFRIGLGLAFYEQAPVEYLEIVKNGFVEHEIRLKELAEQQGKLPPLQFDSSGWFLVRAMTSTRNNYQFASTGPYYVEADYKPRISRGSVQFFLEWLDAANKEFAGNKAVLAEIAAARPFWQELLNKANAE